MFMSRPQRALFPDTQRRATAMGARLRLARRRRGITGAEMAARCLVSWPTITRLERGEPSVSLAVLARYLEVLGLVDDLDRIAANDETGAAIADERLGQGRSKQSRGLADEI
jgi:transcriptional regulator with XRE-family HTH domain